MARDMTIDELQRGSGNANPPAVGAPLQVLVVKTFGFYPGLLVADSKGQLYLLRFDPVGYEGLATGAEMVTSRLFYALGYHVPRELHREVRTRPACGDPEGQAVSSSGRPRALVAADIDLFLRGVPVGPDLPRGGNAATRGARVAGRAISGLGHQARRP